MAMKKVTSCFFALWAHTVSHPTPKKKHRPPPFHCFFFGKGREKTKFLTIISLYCLIKNILIWFITRSRSLNSLLSCWTFVMVRSRERKQLSDRTEVFFCATQNVTLIFNWVWLWQIKHPLIRMSIVIKIHIYWKRKLKILYGV